MNSDHPRETKYATLVHELAHLYCGHLGTPNESWWPGRRGLSDAQVEFEAESVCYLVCERAGLRNPSGPYLSDYLQENDETPAISMECVLKSAKLIEQMGRERLKPREEKRGGKKSGIQ